MAGPPPVLSPRRSLRRWRGAGRARGRAWGQSCAPHRARAGHLQPGLRPRGPTTDPRISVLAGHRGDDRTATCPSTFGAGLPRPWSKPSAWQPSPHTGSLTLSVQPPSLVPLTSSEASPPATTQPILPGPRILGLLGPHTALPRLQGQ